MSGVTWISASAASALVEAEYEVRAGSDQVRLAVMRRDDLEHLREGLAHGVVEATEPGRSGKLTCQVRPPANTWWCR